MLVVGGEKGVEGQREAVRQNEGAITQIGVPAFIANKTADIAPAAMATSDTARMPPRSQASLGTA